MLNKQKLEQMITECGLNLKLSVHHRFGNCKQAVTTSVVKFKFKNSKKNCTLSCRHSFSLAHLNSTLGCNFLRPRPMALFFMFWIFFDNSANQSNRVSPLAAFAQHNYMQRSDRLLTSREL